MHNKHNVTRQHSTRTKHGGKDVSAKMRMTANCKQHRYMPSEGPRVHCALRCRPTFIHLRLALFLLVFFFSPTASATGWGGGVVRRSTGFLGREGRPPALGTRSSPPLLAATPNITGRKHNGDAPPRKPRGEGRQESWRGGGGLGKKVVREVWEIGER